MQQADLEKHRALVYGWAYRLLQNHHDALDVTQEVLIRGWQAAQADMQAPANPLGWLRRVTINLAIDWNRSSARRRKLTGPVGSAESPQHDAIRRERCRQVAQALRTLTDRQRSVVLAKVFDGCTFAKIAEELDLSVSSVKSHYVRGLAALKNKLPE